MTAPSPAGGSATGRPLVVGVDRDRCVGTGLCAATAPADLALGPDGRAHPLAADAARSDALTEAAEMCPVEAITVRLATTGEQIAPLP